MTEVAIKEQIEMIHKLTAKAMESKESALQILKDSGIWNLIHQDSVLQPELKK